MSTGAQTAKDFVLAIAGGIAGNLGTPYVLAFGTLLSTTLAALGLGQLAPQRWLEITVGLALVNFAIVGILSSRSRRATRIVKSCGITRFWPAHDQDQAWQDCVRAFSNHDEILIADLTGAQTYEGSALGAALGAHQGNIKVIFVRPDSPAFEQHIADAAGYNDHAATVAAVQYRSEHKRALRFFMQLCEITKNKRRSIEIRECDYGAIWRMVISGERLWLQHLEPTRPEADWPMYMFTRDHGTMGPCFERMFHERWDSSRPLLRQDENGRSAWPPPVCK